VKEGIKTLKKNIQQKSYKNELDKKGTKACILRGVKKSVMCRSQISLDQAPRLCHSSFSFYIFLKEQRIVEYLSPYSSIIQTLIFRYSIHQS
jgi:hypothetical protein